MNANILRSFFLSSSPLCSHGHHFLGVARLVGETHSIGISANPGGVNEDICPSWHSELFSKNAALLLVKRVARQGEDM